MVEEFYLAGKDCRIQENCIVGLQYKEGCKQVILGDGARIRSGSIIYADSKMGDDFQTGHNVVIREKSILGDHIVVGTNTVIDGNVEIGDFVKIESNCYIPTHVKIGSYVFFGPGVTIANDKYPLKMRDQYVPEGPVIEDGVTLGAGAVLVPGIRIGEDSFVAAGALVTKDVPARSFVVGNPGKIQPLPDHLTERNIALSWRKYLNA